jgi:hypothetical protein
VPLLRAGIHLNTQKTKHNENTDFPIPVNQIIKLLPKNKENAWRKWWRIVIALK